MGLDFIVYKKRKDESFRDALRNEDNELAYGRKSWELVYELVPNFRQYDFGDSEYVDPLVTKEAWDSLMEKMTPIGDKLEAISEAYYTEINSSDDLLKSALDKLDAIEKVLRTNGIISLEEYSNIVSTIKHKRLITEYESWYDRTFDVSPTLGYDFSVGYMKAFWNANEKVQEVFADPDMEIRACVSY